MSEDAVTADAEKVAQRLASISASRPVIVDRGTAANERVATRACVYRNGRLAVTGGAEINCIIVDTSATGARVQLDGAANLPDFVTLRIVATGAWRRARVVWRRDNAAGLSFSVEQRVSFGSATARE